MGRPALTVSAGRNNVKVVGDLPASNRWLRPSILRGPGPCLIRSLLTGRARTRIGMVVGLRLGIPGSALEVLVPGSALLVVVPGSAWHYY